MLKRIYLSTLITVLLGGTAMAQSPHGIAAVVNDDIVTTPVSYTHLTLPTTPYV